ncbi:MAG: neutral/alkaline non-lysosomal ceramidase N-terminal domain-containing protein, partial [Candidatus Rokubacteria bacterium]|nr:neutral/alkaline non-lysosomal ceramidase N-terminal domain-containing protein [Candidatus Rokubacteria bacterium]
TFWFNPSSGVHDPFRVRALAFESGGLRVVWLSVDLVAVDPTMVAEVRARLADRGGEPPILIVSASHTHSGPGAYGISAFWALVAADRESPAVRKAILDGMEKAARDALRRRAPALLAWGKTTVTGVAMSRLDQPLDPELGLLKVMGGDGRPVALLWNYAVHGTALGRTNSLLSGDLMADASARLERETGAPVLFVNGAAGDVSPRQRGWPGVESAGAALASAALAAWRTLPPGRDLTLRAVRSQVSLPGSALSVRNCTGRWVPAAFRLGLGWTLPSSAGLTAVRIGGTAWVTVPGELQTRLGLDIKTAGRRTYDETFVAGYSNDYLGYFLTRRDYGQPSYVACGSFYGESGGEIVRDAAVELLGRLAEMRPRG